MDNYIPYGRQKIFTSDFHEVKKALKSNLISGGKYVSKFENLFKNFTGSKYAISCSSGTGAIHLVLESINLKKNDNIIIPAVNFIAAANLSKKLQANIYLADVDEFSGQMTPANLLDCIKKYRLKKVKAFFVMHNGGNPKYAKDFYQIKKKINAYLIEDACHALGANYYSSKKNLNKKKVGSCIYSDITVFSLHPLKSITTGEGGMITTSNKKIFKKIQLLRNHGIVRKKSTKKKYHWSYDVILPGYNYRLSDINCALGFSQLRNINKLINKRKKIAQYYSKSFKDFRNLIKVPDYKKNINSAWHLYIVNINFSNLKINKEDLINELYKKKIITQIHYIPAFLQKVFKNIKKKNYKNSLKYFRNSISLPIYYDLNKKKQNYVIKHLKNILKFQSIELNN